MASFEVLRNSLLELDPAGAAGFEGLLAAVLENIMGIPFRLAASGSQRGLDAHSAYSDDAVLIEAKRYQGHIPRSDVLVKIVDVALQQPDADLWILGATSRVSAQLNQDVRKTGEIYGLSTLVLDWGSGSLPALAVLLAMAEETVVNFLSERLPNVDVPRLRRSLSQVKCDPSFPAHRSSVERELGACVSGAPVARLRASEHLRDVLSSEGKSRQFLRQPLAPGAAPPGGPARKELTSSVIRFFCDAPDRKIGLVLGGEGHGKSWLIAATWLSLRAPPLVVFLPSGSFSKESQPSNSDRLLIEALISATQGEQTEREYKKWARTFSRWKIAARPNDPRLVLIVDGINQHPQIDWGRMLDALNESLHLLGGRLLVTSRDGFFENQVGSRLRSQRDIVIVPEWSDAERDAILAGHNVHPQSLHEDVLSALRNPRLLAVALKLLSSTIETLEELSVSRLLFEHMRSLEADASEPMPAGAFAKKLQQHASVVLQRKQAQQEEDLLIFEGQLDAASSGRFYRPLPGEHGRYMLNGEGLDLALGLAIIDLARRAERNYPDIIEPLSAIFEPISALDRTAGALFAGVTASCLDETCSDGLVSALVISFLDLQNVDDRLFVPFCELARKRPEAFMHAAQRAAAVRSRSRSDELLLALRMARRYREIWDRMRPIVSLWLRTYSLKPIGRYALGRQTPDARKEGQERERVELEAKWNALRPSEQAILQRMNLDDDVDRPRLSELAFSVLAGMPLALFAPDLVAWRVGAALQANHEEPYDLFAHLLRLNVSDWAQTRETLLSVTAKLRDDSSNVGKWALQGVLYATGDSGDAVEAETLHAQLSPHSQVRQGWHYVEKICDTDPCDPTSPLPGNLAPTSEAYANIDVSAIRTQLSMSSADLDWTRARAAMARFDANTGLSKHRQFLADVHGRVGFPLRQGVLELRLHSMLIEREDALRLVRRVHDGTAGMSDSDLDDTSRFITAQYHLLLAFPQLSAEEQIDAMLTPHSTHKILLRLLDSAKQSDPDLFADRFSRAFQERRSLELYVLLAFASATKVILRSSVCDVLPGLAQGTDVKLRARALQLIASSAEPRLLKDFSSTTWSALALAEGDRQERWYGSWAILEAARAGLIDPGSVIARIDCELLGVAARYLGHGVASEAGRWIDLALKQTSQLVISSPSPELELQRDPKNDLEMPRFQIETGAKPAESIEEALRQDEETVEQSQVRMQEASDQFDKFRHTLSQAHAHMVLHSLRMEELSSIALSCPELAVSWINILMNLPGRRLQAVHNFGVMLAFAMSTSDIDAAVELFQRFKDVSPFLHQCFGGAKVPLEAHALWSAADGPQLNKLRFDRLDRADNDEAIAKEVIAAQSLGKTEILQSYILQRRATGNPAHFARALTVCGLSTQNELATAVLAESVGLRGFLAEVRDEAQSAYVRHTWAMHWFNEMRSANSVEDLWRFAHLFRKVVDGRFEIVLALDEKGNALFERYRPAILDDLNSRYEKRASKRRSQLFGGKAPPRDFLH